MLRYLFMPSAGIFPYEDGMGFVSRFVPINGTRYDKLNPFDSCTEPINWLLSGINKYAPLFIYALGRNRTCIKALEELRSIH
ncbi:MAG: hypothetical protein UW70_C0013G0001 [Candidatus Peregrinibacteria bacterium GW2011_GWA2_44_7]|nr:MAG: hypothetical protein UW70_C0013G0001 [Candidatus Peregrinibacteria bacterium GW2011_GWA2_44_7]